MPRGKKHTKGKQLVAARPKVPNAVLDELLTHAVSGRVDAVTNYLAAGGNPAAIGKISDEYQAPLLHVILVFHHDEVADSIKLLLRAGASVNAPYFNAQLQQQRTPLQLASMCECCTAPLEALLQGGAEPLYRAETDSKTALHIAAECGNVAKCELLLNAGGRHALKVQDISGATPVHHAASRGYTAVLELMHKRGAKLGMSHSDTKFETPLHVAARQGHVDTMRYLVQHGADVNAVERNSETPLIRAASSGSVEAVQLLLDAGAKLQHVNCKGMSALFAAAADGSLAVLQLLISKGLSVHSTACDGHTPLMEAALEGRLDVARALLEAEVDVDAVTDVVGCALHWASNKPDRAEMIKLLLEYGADTGIGCTPPREMPALFVAISTGHMENIRALLDCSPNNVAYINSAGVTAVAMAVRYGTPAVLAAVLDSLKTSANVSREEVHAVLEARSQWCRCCGPMSALLGCSQHQMTKLLIDAGADVYATCSQGNTCLHVACKHRYTVPVVCVMVKGGADPIAMSARQHKMPLQMAMETGNQLMAQVLVRAMEEQEALLADAEAEEDEDDYDDDEDEDYDDEDCEEDFDEAELEGCEGPNAAAAADACAAGARPAAAAATAGTKRRDTGIIITGGEGYNTSGWEDLKRL